MPWGHTSATGDWAFGSLPAATKQEAGQYFDVFHYTEYSRILLVTKHNQVMFQGLGEVDGWPGSGSRTEAGNRHWQVRQGCKSWKRWKDGGRDGSRGWKGVRADG